MTVTINLYGSVIKKLEEAALDALDATAQQLHADVIDAHVVPFDVGTMQNDASYIDLSKRTQGVETLVTSTPYARRLYYHPEYHFQKGNNPHAKGRWLEDWLDGGKYANRIRQDYAKFYKQFGGI